MIPLARYNQNNLLVDLFYVLFNLFSDAVPMPDSGVCPVGKIKQGTITSVENFVKYCGR